MQQKVHELVFYPEELESDNGDGLVLFVEAVAKEDGGVPGRLLKYSSFGKRIPLIKTFWYSILFRGGILYLLVADAIPSRIFWVKYPQQLLIRKKQTNSSIHSEKNLLGGSESLKFRLKRNGFNDYLLLEGFIFGFQYFVNNIKRDG